MVEGVAGALVVLGEVCASLALALALPEDFFQLAASVLADADDSLYSRHSDSRCPLLPQKSHMGLPAAT